MHFRLLRGYATEGRNNLRAALALPAVQGSDVAHAHALYVGAALASSQSDDAEAGRMLEACLALRRGLGNPVEIAATLSTLAQVRLHEGDAETARASEEEALGIFRQLGERIGEAIGLSHLGEICMYVSDDAKARSTSSNAWPSFVRSATPSSRASASAFSASSRWTPAICRRRARGWRARWKSAARPRTGGAKRWRCGGPGRSDLAEGDGDAARDKLEPGAARLPGLRDERRDAELPRGPCGAAAVGRRRAPMPRACTRRSRLRGRGLRYRVRRAARSVLATPSRRHAARWATPRSTPRGPRERRGRWTHAIQRALASELPVTA